MVKVTKFLERNQFLPNYTSQKLKLFIIKSWTLISFFYLLFQYREGGPKDFGVTDTSIRDVGAYVDSGLRIIHGINPYIAQGSVWSGARWGTFGTLPLAFFSLAVPRNFQSTSYQILGFIGTYIFIAYFFEKLTKEKKYLLFATIIWTSAFREMLATDQITGIVLGCAAVGIKLSMDFSGKNSKFRKLIGYLSLAISLDLKPHITGLLIIGTFIYLKKWYKMIVFFVVYIFCHVLVDLWLGKVTEIDWYHTVLGLNSISNDGLLGDSVTFWPVLRRFLNLGSVFGPVSKITLFALLLITIYSAAKSKPRMFLLLSLFVPSVSIYFHYYDEIALLCLTIAVILNSQNGVVSIFILDFLLISKEGTNLKNVLLVIFLSVALSSFQSRTKLNHWRQALTLSAGLILWCGLLFINRHSNSSDHDLQALVVTEVTALCTVFVVLQTLPTRIRIHFGTFLE